MTIEAYQIAIKLALEEKVTTGLAGLSTQFNTLNTRAEQFQTTLTNLGKIGGVGAGLAKAIDGPFEKTIEYERQLAQLRQGGLSSSQVEEAKKFVESTAIINAAELDRLRILTQTQKLYHDMGKSGEDALKAAKTMMPILAQYEVATAALSGSKHDAALQSLPGLNKVIGLMGGAGDANRAQDIADMAFKATQSSGKMVDEEQLAQFAAQSSTATSQQSLRTIGGFLLPIIGQLGGVESARDLESAYTRANGMLPKSPQLMQAELKRLGMADGSGTKQSASLAALQATNLNEYVKAVMEKYQAAGINSATDRNRENALLFGTEGAKVFNPIMAQMEVLNRSLTAYDQAKGASEVINDPANQSIMEQRRLAARYQDLLLSIGQSNMPLVVEELERLSDALGVLTQFARDNPTLVKMLTGVAEGTALYGMGKILFSGLKGAAKAAPLLETATGVAAGGMAATLGPVLGLVGAGAGFAYGFPRLANWLVHLGGRKDTNMGGHGLTPAAEAAIEAAAHAKEKAKPQHYAAPQHNSKGSVLHTTVKLDGKVLVEAVTKAVVESMNNRSQGGEVDYGNVPMLPGY